LVQDLENLGIRLGTLPKTLLVPLPNREACNAQVIRDIPNDKRHKPRIRKEANRQRNPNENHGVFRRLLDDRCKADLGKVGINCSEERPNPNPVPDGEGRAGNVCEDHSSDLVCELEAPCTEERQERGRVENPRVVIPGVEQPEDLDGGREDEGE